MTGTREKGDDQKGAPGRREMVENKHGDEKFRAGRRETVKIKGHVKKSFA